MSQDTGGMQQVPQRYEPAEAVVAPAFSELVMRVSRARATAVGSAALGGEERVLFDYGVSQRRRVLEHTLFLVFAQWAVYRQFISRLSSRFARSAYGFVAFGTTVTFARYRAALVTQDLFAHVITRDTDSALSNEARIVLAELEGPYGPYFRSVCEDRGFTSQYEEAVAAKEIETSGNLDQHEASLHPQLRLTPRLLTPEVIEATQHPNIRPNRSRASRFPNNSGPPLSRQKRERGLADLVNDDEDTTSDDSFEVMDRDSHAPSNVWAQIRSSGSKPASSANSATTVDRITDNSSDNDTINWATPFDFSKAVHDASPDSSHFSGSDSGNDFRDNPVYGRSDGDDSDNRHEAHLTPAQRRAEERRRRRHEAKLRASSNGADVS